MGALNLVPLIILFLVVGGVGWVGYQVCKLNLTASTIRASKHHLHPIEPSQSHITNMVCLDLPLLERARRARRPQDGKEECRVHQGWREGRRQRSQCRAVRG